jgi:hypothetical protein
MYRKGLEFTADSIAAQSDNVSHYVIKNIKTGRQLTLPFTGWHMREITNNSTPVKVQEIRLLEGAIELSRSMALVIVNDWNRKAPDEYKYYIG